MSTTKKIILRAMPIVLVLLVISSNVFAWNAFNLNSNETNNISGINGNNLKIGTANNAVNRIWGTVTLILQVLAVAAIVIAGVRYMFASADGKADIKKQTIGLVAGAILVFAASSVVKFVVEVTKNVTGN